MPLESIFPVCLYFYVLDAMTCFYETDHLKPILGAGNSSEWMTEKKYVQFIKHFKKHVKPIIAGPVLLLLDNHQSHVNAQVVKKAKENNVVRFSFPPHCSYNLQPVDVRVYGPFKNYFSRF